MARKKQLITRAGRGPTAKVTVTAAGLKVIENMTAEGNDQRTVARALGVMAKTFRYIRDRDERVAAACEVGFARLADELTHILLQHARKGNVVAAIFLSKARLGWVEGKPAEGHTPKVNVNITIPPAMSDKEFAKIVEGKAVVVEADGPAKLTKL